MAVIPNLHAQINNFMILRELFYYDQITTELANRSNMMLLKIKPIMSLDDTRKTRLSLKQINKARKSHEFQSKDEQQKELEFVRQMYGALNQSKCNK